MPPSAAPIPLWCSAVETLEQLVSVLEQTGGVTALDFAALHTQLRAACDKTNLADATVLAALVQQLQLPLRIGKACSKAVQHGGPLCEVVMAAIELNYNLIRAVMQPRATAAAASSSITSITTSQSDATVASIVSQLQQSRVLQRYPQMLTAAASKVSASATFSAAAAAAGNSSTGGVVENAMLTMTLVFSLQLIELQQVANEFGGAAETCAALLPVSAPIAHVMVAAMQLLSTILPPPPPQQQQQQRRQQRPQSKHWADLQTLCLQNIKAAGQLLAGIGRLYASVGRQEPLPEPVTAQLLATLQSPHIARGVALLLAADGLSLAATQHIAVAQAAGRTQNKQRSGRGHSSSSTQTKDDAAAAAAWEQTAELIGSNSLLTPCHQQLFELLGVSQQAVVWAAAFEAQLQPQLPLHYFNSLPVTVLLLVHQDFEGISYEQLQQHCALLILTVSPLLHATTQLPAHSTLSADEKLEHAIKALVTCNTLIEAFANASVRGHGHTNASGSDLMLLPEAWLQQALAHTLQIGNYVLQLTYPQGKSTATAAAVASPFCDGLGCSHPIYPVFEFLEDLMNRNYTYLCFRLQELQEQQPPPLDVEQQRQEAYNSLDAAVAVFQPHAADIFAVAEGVVRHAAATLAAGRPLDDDARGAILLLTRRWDFCPQAMLLTVAVRPPNSSAAQARYASLLCSICKLAGLLLEHEPDALAPVALSEELTPAAAAELLGGVYTQVATKCLGYVLLATGVLLGADGAAGGGTASAGTATAAGESTAAGAGWSVMQALPTLMLFHRAAVAGCMSKPHMLLPLVHSGTRCVLGWLQCEHVAAELSAAGYQHQQLVEATAPLLAALDAASPSYRGEMEAAAISAVQAACKSAADATSAAVATPAICNNPACATVGGPTESSSVSGRACRCGRCHLARYCSKSCQTVHWKQHRCTCKALAAAAAGAGVGGGGGSRVAGVGQAR